jgi:putative transposase
LSLRQKYPRWGKDKLVVLLRRDKHIVSTSMVGRIEQPGDLLEIATKEIRMRGGVILKHFSARDVVSRWDVLEVHRRSTSMAAARFLDTLLDRVPFPVKALQVDGGGEFAAAFEQACQQKELPLFVLPPKSPKLNTHVERSHRTHNEEFYQVQAESDQVPLLNFQLRHWEKTYNCIRPQQPLGYLTPPRIYQPLETPTQKGKVSLIYWTSTTH